MKVIGIDLSVLIIAVITAYIGYQFNHRSKKRDAFLKELINSYNEVYFPMFERLSIIIEIEEKPRKLELIDSFMQEHLGTASKIRFIGSSFILDYFYKLREAYSKYKKESNRGNERKLLEKVQGFYIMIEDEYRNAHDIIYEDYKQFVSDTFNNPFFVVLSSIFRILYHLSVFLFWISALILYYTISHLIIPIDWVPEWWNIGTALLLLGLATMLFGIMMMFKEMVMKKNRRESKVVKNLKGRIKRIFCK
ncbi:hypothetical protein [Paenibacillus sp. IHBB 10380]|uniref:hypothetical protein n=1 Tax=Paenibacillus sp. IHBB 10380 TaxID=1566358 RepID=UPI0005CFE7F3|nr:hypothetical protein [Paenibacillus sp. IHBB 10380]AJS58271.1 hypothetical protein UB51_06920 [Paenibacillus sp. IHBB 10380]